MKLTPETTILTLVKKFPFLIEALARKNPVFDKLRNPVLRNTMGRIATVERAASMGKEETLDLMLFIAGRIMAITGEAVEILPPKVQTSPDWFAPLPDDQRLEGLKEIIRQLHEGADLQLLQERFARVAGNISPEEIARLEQTLVNEGLPETEIKKLCTLHVGLFKSSLDEQEPPKMPAGHPVHTYMEENRKISELTEMLNQELDRLGEQPNDTLWSFTVNSLRNLVAELSEVKTHYVRKENQLFPLLEFHGLEAPPKVMWEVHDDIREQLKTSAELLRGDNRTRAIKSLLELSAAVKDMIYKEEHILFPMTIATLREEDWAKVRSGDDEIGYCFDVTPGSDWVPVQVQKVAEEDKAELVSLDTGDLSPEIINTILCNLPLDISMVDAGDKVVYYSDSNHRIFPRSSSVIGRDVKNCHPPKSVHMVEEILEKFKSGERDRAEFWLELSGKFIYIQYLALKNKTGNYLGCLEVSQDATQLRSLSGQRRLLNWD